MPLILNQNLSSLGVVKAFNNSASCKNEYVHINPAPRKSETLMVEGCFREAYGAPHVCREQTRML